MFNRGVISTRPLVVLLAVLALAMLFFLLQAEGGLSTFWEQVQSGLAAFGVTID